VPDSRDIDGVVLDDEFVRAGVYEAPARTRIAVARYGGKSTSWRHPIPPVLRVDVTPIRDRHRFRVSWIFVALVAGFVAAGVSVWDGAGGRVAVFAFVLGGWMVSLCVHEFAHAAVGFHGGDRSVPANGYLRLDIRRSAHPILSFVLPVVFLIAGGVGLPGGAVWIDKGAIPRRRWAAATSYAGPAANAACALACLLPFSLGLLTPHVLAEHTSFAAALAFLGWVQLMAVVLNLLPVPGLDGWGGLEPYLPRHIAAAGQRLAPVAFLVLFVLLLRIPAASHEMSALLNHINHAFHVPTGLANAGYTQARFWTHATR
jgi:Zn-dependent protease